VLVPATITSQPVSQSVLLSNNASLLVVAYGTAPLNYQWYFNGLPLTDDGHVHGSATTNLNIANVQGSDAGSYQLIVTNNYGSSTSAVATLTLLLPPTILASPPDQWVAVGIQPIFRRQLRELPRSIFSGREMEPTSPMAVVIMGLMKLPGPVRHLPSAVLAPVIPVFTRWWSPICMARQPVHLQCSRLGIRRYRSPLTRYTKTRGLMAQPHSPPSSVARRPLLFIGNERG